MGNVDAFIDEALSHNGYLETPGNYTKFGAWYGWNGVAWCHIWVSYVAAHSGNEDIVPRTAGCAYGWDWFRDRGQFFRRGAKTPRKGDIVYYGPTGGDHVGIVYAVKNGHIYTIEGNTSKSSGFNPNGGGVHKKKWPLDYSRIYGYGRPAFSHDSPEDGAPNMDISLGSKNWIGRPRKGQALFMNYDVEYADPEKQHGDGKAYPTILMTYADYIATAAVTVNGLPEGGSCWIRFVEVEKAKDGSFPVVETGPTRTIRGADGPVYESLTNVGTVNKGQRLRVQMGGFSHDGVTVKPTSVKVHAWRK